MLALAKHANMVGEATAKLAELARICRSTEADVRDSIRQAVKLKEVAIFQNTGPGRRTAY
jgi:hypothetical protein